MLGDDYPCPRTCGCGFAAAAAAEAARARGRRTASGAHKQGLVRAQYGVVLRGRAASAQWLYAGGAAGAA